MLTEKQDEIAWQTFCKVDGPQEKRVYAAVEAVLAAVRLQIEAERDARWEKAIRDTTVVCDMEPNLCEVFMEDVLSGLTPAQKPKERKGVKDLLCARISGQNVCFDADGYDANIIEAYRRGRAEIGEKK